MLYLTSAACGMTLTATLKPCWALIVKTLSAWVLFSPGEDGNWQALWSGWKELGTSEPDCLGIQDIGFSAELSSTESDG